jgi:hypothetical protein
MIPAGCGAATLQTASSGRRQPDPSLANIQPITVAGNGGTGYVPLASRNDADRNGSDSLIDQCHCVISNANDRFSLHIDASAGEVQDALMTCVDGMLMRR